MTRLPFGRETRVRILREHLAEKSEVTASTAWQFIYEELLWIDSSTGLAHLYESDKAQPGRPWYSRTLVFTNFLCEKFGNITVAELRTRIDRLFRAIIADLQKKLPESKVNEDAVTQALTEAASDDQVIDQLVAITDASLDMQSTNNVVDEELIAEFTQLIRQRTDLDAQQARTLAETMAKRARLYYNLGNKRQNLLGEGFEDILQILMMRVARVPENRIMMRTRANKLPGFKRKSNRKREEAPDIAVISGETTQLLASVKWSIRHDRQKQFADEMDSYAELLAQSFRPMYVIITNEYDPARLQFICSMEPHKGFEVDQVYHINTEILLGVLAGHARWNEIKALTDTGKLRPIESFFHDLAANFSK